MNFKKSLKDVLVLVIICAVFATVLAAVNSVTAPIIAQRLENAANEAYFGVMEGAEGFETVTTDKAIPSTVKEIKKETSGKGYAIKIETKGYDSGLILIIGVNPDGVVTGATCIASKETNKQENSYGANFIGKDLDGVNAVDLIVGGHQRHRLCLPDTDFKALQIDFPKRPGSDGVVQRKPVIFLIVGSKMLDGDTTALDALYTPGEGCSGFTGEQRIF